MEKALVLILLLVPLSRCKLVFRYGSRSSPRDLGRQNVASSSQSGTTSVDLSQVSDVLKRIKEFDKLNCIPRILCQYLSSQSLEDILQGALFGQQGAIPGQPGAIPGQPGGIFGQSGGIFGQPGGIFGQPGTFLGQLGRIFGQQRLRRRLNRVQPKTFEEPTQIIRFLDLLNLDSLSFYPYLRGALLGFTVRREDQCVREFPTCPPNEDEVLDYLNNHQGGFFKIFNS